MKRTGFPTFRRKKKVTEPQGQANITAIASEVPNTNQVPNQTKTVGTMDKICDKICDRVPQKGEDTDSFLE